jgi:hypothetical protein
VIFKLRRSVLIRMRVVTGARKILVAMFGVVLAGSGLVGLTARAQTSTSTASSLDTVGLLGAGRLVFGL